MPQENKMKKKKIKKKNIKIDEDEFNKEDNNDKKDNIGEEFILEEWEVYNDKNKNIDNSVKFDNIKGRAQRKDKIQNNNYKQNINNNEKQFQNTKTKIKVTLFQNGFILNNGEFRDKRILIHYHG